ncbi:hypothetical protein E6W17_09865 [Streptomyces sp. A1547]|nr:hypothetical protein E6W17_09865 [Streptomyces sp. A1547]
MSVRVGITGHRGLSTEGEQRVRAILTEVVTEYDAGELVAVSCIADRLVAQGAESSEMPSGAARLDDDALRDATEARSKPDRRTPHRPLPPARRAPPADELPSTVAGRSVTAGATASATNTLQEAPSGSTPGDHRPEHPAGPRRRAVPAATRGPGHCTDPSARSNVGCVRAVSW